MIPKEKAVDLYERFYYALPSEDDDGRAEDLLAKKLALICVDEIIKVAPSDKYRLKEYEDIDYQIDEELTFEYWIKVKNELEKL